MSDFDWNDLRAFLAIARAGRLTTAAQQIGVDHSTLSRRVMALETALGTRLFDRRTTGFILTADGERLIADAEQMESVAITMRSRLEDASQHLTGTIRIGTPEGFGTYFLAPRLAAIAGLHRGLAIELVANPRTFSLSKREADLAVTMARPETGRLYARKLIDYTLGLYAAPAYLERHDTIRSRSDLADHCWVAYVDDLLWTHELNYLPDILPNLTARIRISNVITQMKAVCGSVGLGVIPHFMARDEPGIVPVLAHDVRLLRSYWLVTHAETRDLLRVRLIMDFISSAIEETGEAFWLAQRG